MSDVELSYEREVLGAALRGIAWEHLAQIHPDEMSLDNHRLIWGAIADLVRDEIPLSVTTIADQLGSKLESVGGRAALLELRDDAVITDPKHLAHDVRMIRSAAAGRRMMHKLEAIKTGADLRAGIAELAEMAAESFSNGAIHRLADIPDIFTCDLTAPCYVVPELIPQGAMVLMAGEAGIGKSYFALKLATACAMGTRFLGRECMKTAVLYLDRENPGAIIRERVETIAGGPVPGLNIWGGWLAEGVPDLVDPRLLKMATDDKPLILVDSLIRFHAGDENSAGDMSKVIAYLRKLVNAGATVVVLHHRPKGEDASAYRGSSDIGAGPDVLYTLTRDDEGLLTLKHVKNRYGAELKLTIRADFASGTFEQTDAPATEEKRDASEAIADLIADKPGITQNQIVVELHLGRTKTCHILKTGKLWRTEPGQRGAIRYFPLSPVPPVPPVPGTPGIGERLVPPVPTPIRGTGVQVTESQVRGSDYE